MVQSNQTVKSERRTQYHSAAECVICNNKDFTVYEDDGDKFKVVREHRLNYFDINGIRTIVFCNSCLDGLKRSLK